MQMTRGRVLSHATRLAHGRAGRWSRSRGRQQRLGREADRAWSDRLGSGQTVRSCESIWPYTVMSRAVGGFATSAPAPRPSGGQWQWQRPWRAHGHVASCMARCRNGCHGAHAPTRTWALDGMRWDGIGAWRSLGCVGAWVLGAVTGRPRALSERIALAWHLVF